MLVSSFVFLGWRRGLAAVASTFVWMGLSQPIARRTAQRMLGYRTGVEPADDSVDIVERMARGETVESLLSGMGQEEQRRHERLAKLSHRPAIATVLAQK